MFAPSEHFIIHCDHNCRVPASVTQKYAVKLQLSIHYKLPFLARLFWRETV